MDSEKEKSILRRNDHQYVYKQINMDINIILEGDKQSKKESVELRKLNGLSPAFLLI